MPQPDVIVIGAGVVGATVAYRLAAAGARVTVLDAETPGAGASGASFAWTNAFNKPPRAYYELNVASMAEHARLADELGGGLWLKRVGNLRWETSPERQAELDRTSARLREWGYRLDVIAPADARELEPALHLLPEVTEVVWTPEESYVEVIPMIAALLAAATRRGARLRWNAPVRGVLREGSRVRGVELTDGERVAAGFVVNCAGPAAGEIARLAGAPVRVDAEPGRLIYTKPVPVQLSRPIHAPGVHFRPDGAGRVVLADEAHDVQSDRPSDPWTPEESLALAARHLPALSGATVEAIRIGRRPMPADRLPLVGSIPGLDGFYVVVSHSGVTLAPLWAKIATEEILGRREDARLAPFRPSRLLG